MSYFLWIIDKIAPYFLRRYSESKFNMILEDDQIFDIAWDVAQRKEGLFVHLVVRNDGSLDAENALGFVIDVEKLPKIVLKLSDKELADQRFEECKKFRNPVQLKWSHEEGYKPKTVYSAKLEKRPTRLDLCYVFRGENEFHLFTPHYPQGQIVQFGPGVYRLTVLVKWTGGKKTKKFIIYWEGNLKEFGITEDVYGNDIRYLIREKKVVLSKCKDLISEADSRYQETFLQTDSTSTEPVQWGPIETLGTSVTGSHVRDEEKAG